MSRPIAMLVHSYYEEDPRVRRQAESLVAAGHAVDVFSLRRPGDEPRGTLEGVRIHRLDVQRHQGSPIAMYLLEYVAFVLRATVALARAHRRRRYGVVQVHTPPDFLVAAALPVRLLGVPLILDLHEAVPEFFRSRWPRLAIAPVLAALSLVERVSIAGASVALSVNEARRERLERLGVPAAKLRVVPNGPVLARFRPGEHVRRAFMEDGILRLAYAGAVTPLYALEDVVAAMGVVRARRPDLAVELHVYGRGDCEIGLRGQARALGMEKVVVLHGRIPIEEVAAALASSDIVLSPIRRNRFSEISLSTKVLEGAVMDKPVVAADLPTARFYFPGDDLAWYEPDDTASLAAAILRIVDAGPARDGAIERSAGRARAQSWDHEAPAYVALVEVLLRGGLSSGGPPARGLETPLETS